MNESSYFNVDNIMHISDTETNIFNKLWDLIHDEKYIKNKHNLDAYLKKIGLTRKSQLKYIESDDINVFADNLIDKHAAEFERMCNLVPLSCVRFEAYLTDVEISNMESALLELLEYILRTDLINLPSNVKDANRKIHRVSGIRATDHLNNFYPVLKSQATKCHVSSHYNEPVWFSMHPLFLYFSLPNSETIGVSACRQIKDYTDSKSFNMFLDLSSTEKSDKINKAYKINRTLQELINKTMLVLIVRMYCDYSIQKEPSDLTYQYIMANIDSPKFNFVKTVRGYDCDERYRGESVKSLLASWNWVNGNRDSRYNSDRIHVQTLFDIFEIINDHLRSCNEYWYKLSQKGNNHENDSIWFDKFVSFMKSTEPSFSEFQTNINFMGWTCYDAESILDGHLHMFPGEWAISMQYLKQPICFDIFEPKTKICKNQFFQRVGNGISFISQSEALASINVSGGGTNLHGDTIKLNRYNAITPILKGHTTPKNFTSTKDSIKLKNILTPSNIAKTMTTISNAYELSDVPENPNDDLYKLFFDQSNEHLYSNQPPEFGIALNEYRYKLKHSSDLSTGGTKRQKRFTKRKRCRKIRKSRTK